VFNAPRGFNSGPRAPKPPLAGSTTLEAIYSLLTTDPALAALVDDRIHPGGLPQGPLYPCVTFVRAGRDDVRHYDGTGKISEVRIRVSAWSRRQLEADHVAEAVRSRLVDFKGLVGSVPILDCALIDVVDLPEPPTAGSGEHLYQVLLDLRVWRRL